MFRDDNDKTFMGHVGTEIEWRGVYKATEPFIVNYETDVIYKDDSWGIVGKILEENVIEVYFYCIYPSSRRGLYKKMEELREAGEDVVYIDIYSHDSSQTYKELYLGEFTNNMPHTRIRGKKLTHEQLVAVAAKTSISFYNLENGKGRGTHLESELGLDYFRNDITPSRYSRATRSFIHEDGVIGYNYNLDRYCEPEILAGEATILANEFKFLDMIIAVSSWGPYPDAWWDDSYEITEGIGEDDYGTYKDKNLWQGFNNVIEFCIHIKDGKVYWAFGDKAKEMYVGYGAEDEDRFFSDYYEINGTGEFSLDFFKECIEYAGYNFDELIANYRGFDYYIEGWDKWDNK